MQSTEQLHRANAWQAYYAAIWKAAVSRAVMQTNDIDLRAWAETQTRDGPIYPGQWAREKLARRGG